MNVLKPFDDCFLSNEDAIRDLEDYEPSIDDIVTVNGIEVIRNDYDVVNAFVPGYSFEKMVEESRVEFSEKRVSYLGLNSMGLECLSGEIGRLDGLEYLSVESNGLSVLPAEIGNLVELRGLYLGGNGVSVLPVEIGNLIKLRYLDLSCNALSVLPEELCALPNLERLEVWKNPLSDYSVIDKLKEKGVEILK